MSSPHSDDPDYELPPQMERFCQEYVVDYCGKRAAIRAGYSLHTADQQASRLLKNIRVKERIEELQALRAKRIGVSVDRIVQELALIAFSNYQDILSVNPETGDIDVKIDKLDRDFSAPITEVTITGSGKGKQVKIKLADKRQALVDLGKHLGMFKEKVEVEGGLTLEKLVEASMDTKKPSTDGNSSQ